MNDIFQYIFVYTLVVEQPKSCIKVIGIREEKARRMSASISHLATLGGQP